MAKNRLEFQAQLSRHSHNISAGYTASLTTGPIVPQFFHVLGPGDTIYYQNRMFARLQDVVTAFLGEIDIHVDSFFVPLQMLYTPFGQQFAQTDDLISSLIDSGAFPVKDNFPLLDIDHSVENNTPDEYDPYGGESYFKNFARLLDALDANPLLTVGKHAQESMQYQSGTAIDFQVCHNPNVAPWLFAAYQAIYQKYYRNDEIEKLKVAYYNFDFAYNVATFENSDFLTTRYVQRPKDYFTDVRVSPIASVVNSFAQSRYQFPADGGNYNQLLYKVDSFLTSGGTYPFLAQGQSFNQRLQVNPDSAFSNVSTFARETKVDNSSYSAISASNIRALFAVDKFARIYGRADKTYDDQILAHFGIHIPHDVKHDLTHLSHFRAVLQSDPIYSTSNVANSDNQQISALGQVGGQGSVDFTGQQEKFTAPVHGVFMVVAYAVTKPRYLNTFSKLHLLSNRLSFPIPEYDKLGAQPLYAFETHPIFMENASDMSVRIGWQNRYAQFKEKYNRASMIYFNDDYGHHNVSTNIYSPWVIARLPFYGFNGHHPHSSQFVDPLELFQQTDSLDSIMVSKFEKEWDNNFFESPHLMFQTDPILTEFNCSAKLVSWMSETGEPDL